MPGRNLDLLIINPGAAHGIYGDLGKRLVAVEQPLWARLIAGYCRDRGHSVKIIDAEALGLSPDDVAHQVGQLEPRLVCIAVYGHQPSASTQQMVGARATAKAIKQTGPFPIIMVGGHVAALPQQTLREEHINYACNGEGPVTVEGLLRADYQDLRLHEIPGLVWRDPPHSALNIQYNPPAPLLDVAELHGNAWDLLPMNLYRSHNWQAFGDLAKRQPYAAIYTTLGCPFKCDFCCINAPFNSNRYRVRSARDVVAEVEHLATKYGVRTFKIIDEMFVLKEAHYTAVALGLIELQEGMGVEFNFWAYARIDTVKPETLSILRAAGIRWLALGIESADPRVRDGARKAMRNDDIIGVVRAIQAADINVIGNYIFGLRDDDYASMGATFALACELNTEFANFYSAMAYPGSPLYAQAIKEGWTLPETWRGYSQHNDDCRPLDTKHISGAEVLRFRDEAFLAYFGRSRYQNMVRDKFGAETLEHVNEMLTYRLDRKLLRPEPEQPTQEAML